MIEIKLVNHEELPISNAHIINLNKNIGTISDEFGEFKIQAQINDTIQISNIQFVETRLLVNNNMLEIQPYQVKLIPKNNELKEIDLNNNMAKALNLPNADKKPLTQIERKLNYYSQEKTGVVILATLIGQKGGIEDLYNIISGNRKKDRKLKALLDADKKHERREITIENIRSHFTDDFFSETLKISSDYINQFINYSYSDQLEILFIQKRYLEVTDIFFKNQKEFKTKNKLN